MILKEKERTVIQDLQTQEKSCIEKYGKYAQQAKDPELKNLFQTLQKKEQEHYDSLSQVENPLLGQFFNFAAILIFLQDHWFQKLFLNGLKQTFVSMNVFSLIESRESVVNFLLKGLSNLFADAFVIALPIMGTLVLISVCTGLLAKAAPQMNLMSEGFPVMILLSFFLIVMIFQPLCDFFLRSFYTGFNELFSILNFAGGRK